MMDDPQWNDKVDFTKKPFLCRIGLHFFKDVIKLKSELSENGVPFTATETCKRCGYVRTEVTGHMKG